MNQRIKEEEYDNGQRKFSGIIGDGNAVKDRNPSAATEKGSGREKERQMWDACC